MNSIFVSIASATTAPLQNQLEVRRNGDHAGDSCLPGYESGLDIVAHLIHAQVVFREEAHACGIAQPIVSDVRMASAQRLHDFVRPQVGCEDVRRSIAKRDQARVRAVFRNVHGSIQRKVLLAGSFVPLLQIRFLGSGRRADSFFRVLLLSLRRALPLLRIVRPGVMRELEPSEVRPVEKQNALLGSGFGWRKHDARFSLASIFRKIGARGLLAGNHRAEIVVDAQRLKNAPALVPFDTLLMRYFETIGGETLEWRTPGKETGEENDVSRESTASRAAFRTGIQDGVRHSCRPC